MAVISRSRLSTLKYKLRSGGSQATSRQMEVAYRVVPTTLQRGTWITLPGGDKFRKSTQHAKSTVELVPGGPQSTRGSSKDNKTVDVYAMSSNGGFRGDLVLSASNKRPFEVLGVTSVKAPPSIPFLQRNEAVTKALLEVADQKVNLGENLATLNMTLGLVRQPVSQLVDELRKVHRYRSFRPFLYKAARDLFSGNTARKTAEEYLKYVYGWKPLMQDVHGLIDLAAEKSGHPLLIHGRGKAVAEAIGPAHRLDDLSFNTQTLTGPCESSSTTRCNIWARVDPDASGVRALNRLGLLNPLSLNWDLVSWSFVVDWILPIGSMFQALSAPAGLIFVDGSISHKVSLEGPYQHRWTALDQDIIKSDTPADGSVRYAGYTREILSNWPIPGIYIDSDPFRGDRWMKALALSILSMHSLR